MKELIVIFSSTWKFAATFPIAIYLFNMSFFETILYTNIGGFLGIVVFTMFSKGLIKLYNTFWPEKLTCKRKSKKVFTRRNRRLVMLKNKYGLPGIVILTPVLLSIPLGVFLNTKYYGNKKISYLYLLLSQILWSVIYTIIYTQVKTAIA
jgi:hypothetical protein